MFDFDAFLARIDVALDDNQLAMTFPDTDDTEDDE